MGTPAAPRGRLGTPRGGHVQGSATQASYGHLFVKRCAHTFVCINTYVSRKHTWKGALSVISDFQNVIQSTGSVEKTRTQEKVFDTKHKAVIEVFMPKCTVNQTYGGIYRLVGLFERFGRSVLISQK